MLIVQPERRWEIRPLLDTPQARAGSSAPPIADGYYYQLISDPRTLSGWTSTTKFHDLLVRDTTTTEETAAGGPTKTMSFLIVKAVGMTIDEILPTVGYAGTLSFGALYGSNDGIVWDAIVYGLGAPIGHVVFGYNITIDMTMSASGPYKYLVCTFTDTSGSAKVGIGDLRALLATVDVGPP